jgi:hypothetical protein
LIVVVGAVALVLAADPAVAKIAADEITLEGPGLASPLAVGCCDSEGDRTGPSTFASLIDGSSINSAVWGEPSSRTITDPPDELGPAYRATWRFQGPEGSVPVVQTWYPYAEGGPVVHTEPGQPLWDVRTAGGWHRAPESFVTALSRIGVPPVDEASASPAVTQDDGLPWSAIVLSSAALVVGGFVAMSTLSRRRTRVALT